MKGFRKYFWNVAPRGGDSAQAGRIRKQTEKQEKAKEYLALLEEVQGKMYPVNADLPFFSPSAGKRKQKILFNRHIPHLNYLFAETPFRLALFNLFSLPKFVFIWGLHYSKSKVKVLRFARRHNIPVCVIEDGFLKSARTSVAHSKRGVAPKYLQGVAFVIDNQGLYIDAHRPSRLETMLNDENLVITEAQKERARKLITKIVETHLTKYNHQPIIVPKIGRPGVKKVLVIDQSYGDASIGQGLGRDKTFEDMLRAAIDENPDADIIVKTHPDTMAGAGGYYTGLKAQGNVYTMTTAINPICLTQYADKVYVCTTQLGMEALMCGKEVHVFGMPFYAGWGLTQDRQQCSRRKTKRTLEELFYISYILYCHYIDPRTKKRCEIEDAIDYLLELRKEYFEEYGVKNELTE